MDESQWTKADGPELDQVLREDTQVGEAIQESVEPYGFGGAPPLSRQEARITSGENPPIT